MWSVKNLVLCLVLCNALACGPKIKALGYTYALISSGILTPLTILRAIESPARFIGDFVNFTDISWINKS
jgi:hypothetical protein